MAKLSPRKMMSALSNERKEMELVMRMSDEDVNPFAIFPQEVWEEILNNVEDSTDILNVFKAYPVMSTAFHKKKHIWLVDQVVPFLAKWIRKNLLKCRVVSKRWHRAVDNYVQHHPSNRAYNPNPRTHLTGQVWNPIDYPIIPYGREFAQIDLYPRHIPFNISFQNIHTLTEFVKEMELVPREHNPFIGRSVVINRHPWGEPQYVQSFWTHSLHLVREWGEHIWYAEIWEFIDQDPLSVIHTLIESLQHLPNLKSLHVEGNLGWLNKTEEENDILSKLPSPIFPELKDLETLKVDGCLPQLMDNLFSQYATQIRRLAVSMRFWCWQDRYNSLFPNLTELVLVVTGTAMDKVNELFLNLQAPNLFRIYVDFRGNQGKQYKVEEVLAWLRRFPTLKHFHFPCKAIMIPRGAFQVVQSKNNKSHLTLAAQSLMRQYSSKIEYHFMMSFL